MNMDSKSFKQLRRTLTALDTAVRKVYEEHDPKGGTEGILHYGSATFGDVKECGHVAKITLLINKEWIDVRSSKDTI